MKKIILLLVIVSSILIVGCSDAQIASNNLSTRADNFEINRRVVFFNGITDKYLLSIEGRCSISPQNGKLDVTCKTGSSTYKKHFLGLSNNVSYFVEQLEDTPIDAYHYLVIFKPSTIVPNIKVK